MSSFVDLLLDGYYLGAIGIFLAIIISIMLHELAHGFVALWNGDGTAKYNGRLTLNPIKHFDPIGFFMLILVGFGWAKPVPVDSRNFKKYKTGMFTVAIAGVSVNLFLAFFSYPLFYLVINAYTSSSNVFFELLLCFLNGMFFMNLVLVVFNLIPIYPLDGFRIIESFSGYGNRYTRFMYRYGSYILLCFLIILWVVSYFWFDIIGIAASYLAWPIEMFWGLII